ncbi:MAG: glycosyltransferase family 1 protein [Syntrophobacteraceae bacterium]|nr:glycosyltransferase family 4 protein [Desulfobacteraceae bacterium]
MLIDVTRLLGRFMKGRLPTGVDRVCLAYIRHFADRSRVFVHQGRFGLIFSRGASRDLFALLQQPRSDFARSALRIMALSPPLPWSARRCAGRFLFNVGHSGLDRPHYCEWLLARRVRPIYMVHDLIPMTHPEFCRAGEALRHAARMRTVLKTAAGIVTNSRATLQVLSRFAEASGWAMPPAVAAPLGCAVLPRSDAPRPLSDPYFVMLGTIEPRKNHWMMLQVWRRLVERYGASAPKLVLIGQRGWECENVLDMLERCAPLSGVVIERSGCSDAELVRYLRHARALLFPSFTEGFGLPMIEALTLGVPVIAADLPVFHEIAGDVPDYLDPLDGTGWMARIVEYLHPDSPRRAGQLRRMFGFNPPSWEAHFEIMESLMARIVRPESRA